MKMIGKYSKTLFLLLICTVLIAAGYETEQGEKTKEEASILIDQWLIAGPASLPLPVITSEGDEFPVKSLLTLDVLHPLRLWVKEGDKLKWASQKNLKWKIQTAEGGSLNLPSGGSVPQVVFLACYLVSSRWQKTEIEIETNQLLKIFLDGIPVITKSSYPKSDANEMDKMSAELTLSQGKHRLFLTAIKNPQGDPNWSIKASLKPKKEENLAISLTPRRTITEDDIFNSLELSNISLSPDGKTVCYAVSQRNPRTESAEQWIEIRNFPGGKLERVMRDFPQTPRNLGWSPDGRFLSALVPGERGTSDLWLIERSTGQITVLLDDVKGLGNPVWSPTGDFVVYTVTEEQDVEPLKIQKVEKLDDRYPPFVYKTSYYMVMVDSKICRRLTTGLFSASMSYTGAGEPASISPDGNRIQFIKNGLNPEKSPFHIQDFLVLDLGKNTVKSILTSYLRDYDPGDLKSSWSPDGRYIYFVGSQSIGNPSIHPNESDQDLYTLDSDTGQLKCLTDKFDPSVIRMALPRENDSIFLLCQDKSRVQLYKTDMNGKHFQKLNTGIDIVREFDVSSDGSVIVFCGESIQTPPKLFAMNGKGKSLRLIYAPDEGRWKEITFGKVEDFNFKSRRGDIIEGFIYYPVDFDSTRKYPLIVYYYGGVSATSRRFNTRFVSLLQYASNGYFVYVLNPSGATGYGSEFSNLAVNDWGEIAAQEVISGIKKLVKSKTFIDPERIGTFGHSFGGTLTNKLIYKTNMLRSVISMSGTCNLCSYWGGGYWGYSYLGFHLADSYPWNRPDIYVDSSPIFHADKINTPLLLLHGVKDTNVPIIESDQLFTALKILGKEVKYIRFLEEGHGLMSSDKNRRFVPKIMQAWWDKYLKDQPEAWDAIWEKIY